MKLKHYFINLVDLPEILPFSVSEEKIEEIEEQEESGKTLFDFVESIEDKFGSIYYIGQDNIEGKFYQRFMFSEGGFLEIMQKAPSAIIAHFPKKKQAEKFSEVLGEVIKEKSEDKKAAKLLAENIEVSEEKEGSLSYKKWSKLRNIRKNI